jgi:glutamate carboxypeptidase
MFLGNDSLRSLVALADQIHRELGLAGHYPVNMIKGTSDAGYAALESDAAVFESLGPRGDGYHGTDEHIVIASIEPRLYLVARLLMELARR